MLDIRLVLLLRNIMCWSFIGIIIIGIDRAFRSHIVSFILRICNVLTNGEIPVALFALCGFLSTPMGWSIWLRVQTGEVISGVKLPGASLLDILGWGLFLFD